MLSEAQEQERVVEILRRVRPKILFFSVPNERKSKRERAKLARMGVRRGVADLIIVRGSTWPNISLEMKKKGGRASPAQKIWAEEIAAVDGWVSRFAYSAEEALEILRELGVPVPSLLR